MNKQMSALIYATVAMVLSFTVWAVLSPMTTELQKIYGLSGTEKSLLIAVPVILGSIMRIPMGMLTDRFGGKRVYTLLMLFTILPLVGAGFVNSYPAMLAVAFFLGMAGTSFAVGIAYVSRWYPPEKQGLVLGITALGNFGTAVAGFLVPTMVISLGLSWTFWTLAIVMLVMSLLFWMGTSDAKKPKKMKSLRESLSVLKYKNTWLLSVFYFLTFGGFVAFGIYLPTLLQEVFQLSPVDAGMRAAGFVVLATLARPVGGYLADKFNPAKILLVVFGGIMGSAVLMSIGLGSIAIFTIGALFGGAFLGLGNGTVFKLVPLYFPEDTGTVTGIVGAAGGLGGFFPPIILGITKDITGTYMVGFILLALYALIVLIINKKIYLSTSNEGKIISKAIPSNR